MTGTVVTLRECLQSSGLILKELRASLLAGLRRPGIQGMPSPVNQCYRLIATLDLRIARQHDIICLMASAASANAIVVSMAQNIWLGRNPCSHSPKWLFLQTR